MRAWSVIVGYVPCVKRRQESSFSNLFTLLHPKSDDFWSRHPQRLGVWRLVHFGPVPRIPRLGPNNDAYFLFNVEALKARSRRSRI
jgi:hypothetical protein